MTDLWNAIRRLPITIEPTSMQALHPTGPTAEGDYSSTQLSLRGRGEEGVGEQVGLEGSQRSLRASSFPLVGHWDALEDLLVHLDGIDMWPEPPQVELERNWRRWAFESAALDLALCQAATSLPEVLGREPHPVTFVTSFGLGDPPEPAKVGRRRAAHPTVGFKLDVTPAWTREVMEQVAEVDGIATIDFKGQYGRTVDDEAALVAMYERALDAFGDEVTLEDPHSDPRVLELLAPVADRVCYDAPITSVESIAAAPVRVRNVNVKPCRIGRLQELSRLYAHCETTGVRMYNGGMGELGVGRGQAQLLAALFHPDAPNDIAPSEFNLLELPAELPASPLDSSPGRGFRRR